MSIWAIIPVKPLKLGKSRLSGVLSDLERATLNRMFLEQTLSTVKQISEISQTLVVSRDPHALAIAREFNARTVLEDGTPHLNAALARATMLATTHAERGVLILPADLPLLNIEVLSDFVHRAIKPPEMIIAPDRSNEGTNALFLNPGGTIDYSFGTGSFDRHCAAAKEKNLRLEIVNETRLALDLDTPEDLKFVEEFDKQSIQTPVAEVPQSS
jgi:2-phospho-L-lactate guanylyltransferase